VGVGVVGRQRRGIHPLAEFEASPMVLKIISQVGEIDSEA
jgi:hypothetical protein